MKIWRKEIHLEVLEQRSKHSMSEFLGIKFIEVKDDALLASMPVDDHTRQPAGIMHGGASCVLAETVGSTGANFCVDEGYWCVGLDINTNHIRAKKSGFVIATAKPFHLGKSTQVWSIEIHDEEQRLVSVNRLTLAVLRVEDRK